MRIRLARTLLNRVFSPFPVKVFKGLQVVFGNSQYFTFLDAWDHFNPPSLMLLAMLTLALRST